MKIVKLSESQFDKYASEHKYRNYYQTSSYAKLMTKYGYKSQFLGFVNEYNKLIGASLIIYKEAYRKYKTAYAPRGPLFSLENKELVNEMIEKLKDTLEKQDFMLLRIDPYVPISIRAADGSVLNYNEKSNEIISNLRENGFEYKGKNLYFETEKPRWEAIVILQRDEREIFARMDKRTRTKIRRGITSGLGIYKDENKNLEKLYRYIAKKEKKPISYYEDLIEAYGDNIEIYYEKIKTENYVINSRRNYEKEQEYNDSLAGIIQDMSLDPKERESYLNKKMESDKMINAYKNNLLKATELLKNKPEGIIVAGALVIKYDNAAFIITEGVDEKYSPLNAGYLLKWQLIQEFNNQGYKYINLNAIVGDFENKDQRKNRYAGLNEAKLGYDSTITEYIGEFDLVLNSFAYKMFKRKSE